MPRTLYARLAAVFLGIFCIIGIVFITLALFSVRTYEQEVTQRLHRNLAAQIVADRLPSDADTIDGETLKGIFHMLMVVNPNIEVYLLDSDGSILSYSAPEGRVKTDRVDLGPIRDFLRPGTMLPIPGDDPRQPGAKKVFSVAPIPSSGSPARYLYVVLGSEEYESAVAAIKGSFVLQLGVWMTVGALAFALAAGLILFGLLTRRLSRLSREVEAFRREQPARPKSGSPPRTPSPSGDEIDRLAETFRDMAARIDAQLRELAQSDSLRRELVANVSHDLRTPLATLQGYVETLRMKEDQLTTEGRREYLDLAIRHCHRLSKLVGELFELARLDALETSIVTETFSLAELAQDVVQKFGLMGQQRGIVLRTDAAPALPHVEADIGLVERVLENLIGNAVRHTPGGGTIVVSVKETGQQVTTEVLDSGPGIPAEDLPHIFDRFYRGRYEGETGLGQSGLGLAIAKRIVELHGETLQVASPPEGGTIFSFSLPVAASS